MTELERFSCDGMTLNISQCAKCVYVNGLKCNKTQANRLKKYIRNQEKCPHFEKETTK